MNETLLARVRLLKEHYDARRIPRLSEHEVHPDLPPGDRLRYLYFTLPVVINVQRSSPALWRAALQTFEDPETQYLFFPEAVVQQPREVVQRDMLKYKLALQPNRHTDIWRTIAGTLATHYAADPRVFLLEHGQSDVQRILELLCRERRVQFPYLSGAKLSNYWLYILHHYTDIQLAHMEALSIIPDTHVMQCSVRLGLVQEPATPEQVVRAWQTLLQGSELRPVDMHAVLWNWSRARFQPDV